MASKYGVTALYAVILLIHCSVLKTHVETTETSTLKEPEHVLKELEELEKFRYCYLTTWNYVLQLVFLVVAIASDLTRIKEEWKTANKILNKLRSNLFTSITFPLTLLIMSIFWPTWFYDRKMILPKSAEKVITFWINHSLHSFIAVPLIIEIFGARRGGVQVKFRPAFLRFTQFMGAYQVVFFFIYFQYNTYLYPFYYSLDWPQTVVFSLAVYLMGTIYLAIGITLNNRTRTKVISKTN